MRSAFDIKDIVTVITERPDGTSEDIVTHGQVGAVKTVIYDEGVDEYIYEVETGDRSCYLYSVNQLRLALDDEIKSKFFSLATGESYITLK